MAKKLIIEIDRDVIIRMINKQRERVLLDPKYNMYERDIICDELTILGEKVYSYRKNYPKR